MWQHIVYDEYLHVILGNTIFEDYLLGSDDPFGMCLAHFIPTPVSN